MNPEPRTIRASQILGRRTTRGQVADLITETAPDGSQRVISAYLVRRPWGRLLGYERDETTGPWLLERLARAILRRNATEIAFTDLDQPLESPDPTPPPR
jgi:hypothetical protein